MIRSLSQDELEAEGQALGRSLPPGVLLTFEGDLGAGKTTFIKAIARGLGVAGEASSPTYALVHRYHARRMADARKLWDRSCDRLVSQWSGR